MKELLSNLWLLRIVYFLLAFALNVSCASTRNRSNSLTDEDKCNLQPGNTWINGRCVLTKSSAVAKQNCEQQVGAQYLGEKCVSAEELLDLSKKCINDFGAGYYWGEDPQTGQAACLSPKATLTPEQQCAEDKSAVWRDGICYTSEALKCVKGGDIWTVAKTCITPAQKACEDKQDASTWINQRCVSKEEATCISSNGSNFAWNAELNRCMPKTFADYCKDTAASTAIVQTVKAIRSSFGTNTSCEAIEGQLQQAVSLELDALGAAGRPKIADLSPLAAYTQLRSLNFANNAIRDLSPLAGMVHLTSLNLSNNKLDDLRPLATLKELSYLVLDGNSQIKDLSPLIALAQLETLSLQRIQLNNAGVQTLGRADVVISGAMLQLRSLYLNGNCEVSDLKPLSFLQNLSLLGISDTGVNPPDRVPSIFLSKDSSGSYRVLSMSEEGENACTKK